MGTFSIRKDETKYKLSEESARNAVLELVEYYNIDVDAMPDRKQRGQVESALGQLVRFYRMGILENIREGGILKVKQTLQAPPGSMTEIIYGEMSGEAKQASDGYDENDRYHRIYAILSFLTGLTPDAIAKLKRADLSAAEDLGLVFLLG